MAVVGDGNFCGIETVVIVVAADGRSKYNRKILIPICKIIGIVKLV